MLTTITTLASLVQIIDFAIKIADRFSDSPDTKKKLVEISSEISALPQDTPLDDAEKFFLRISTQKLGESHTKSLIAEISYISEILQEAQGKFTSQQVGFSIINYTKYLEFTLNKCHNHFQSWGVYTRFGNRSTQNPIGNDYFLTLYYTSANFMKVRQLHELFTTQFLKRAKLVLETTMFGSPVLKLMDTKETSFTSPVPLDVKLNKHKRAEVFWFRVIFDALSFNEQINRNNAIVQNMFQGIESPKFPRDERIIFEFKDYFNHVWYELISNFVQNQFAKRFPKRDEILRNWGQYKQTDLQYNGENYAYHPQLSFQIVANHELFLAILTGLIADFLYYAALVRKEFEHSEKVISVILGNLTQKAT
jgi:uncharacterized protein YegJ (DUF2314 family)